MKSFTIVSRGHRIDVTDWNGGYYEFRHDFDAVLDFVCDAPKFTYNCKAPTAYDAMIKFSNEVNRRRELQNIAMMERMKPPSESYSQSGWLHVSAD